VSSVVVGVEPSRTKLERRALGQGAHRSRNATQKDSPMLLFLDDKTVEGGYG